MPRFTVYTNDCGKDLYSHLCRLYAPTLTDAMNAAVAKVIDLRPVKIIVVADLAPYPTMKLTKRGLKPLPGTFEQNGRWVR